MECESIKKLIPSYISHTASGEEIKNVEEHLCICNACREYLAKVMDNDIPEENKIADSVHAPEPAEQPKQEEKIDTPAKETKKKADFFEYFILFIGLAVLVFFIRLLLKG